MAEGIEIKDNGTHHFRVAAFIFAGDKVEDGYKVNRSGHPEKVFARLVDAKEYLLKTTKKDPFNWRKTLAK